MNVGPAYEMLAEKLRREIDSGAISPGEYLPSERTLMERERLARGTVRKAIETLVSEGLVVSRNGRGHQVPNWTRLVFTASDPEVNSGFAGGPSDTWSRNVRAQGGEPEETITAQLGYADHEVARWLAVPVGEPMAIRRRLRFVNGEPYSITDSHYPRSIVAGTRVEEPRDVQPGVYAVFAELGRAWVRTEDVFIPRQPTRDETETLHIPRGVAVGVVVRRSFDADDIPVRLTTFVLPGDRHVIRYAHSEAAA